jgi:hypothetical protein
VALQWDLELEISGMVFWEHQNASAVLRAQRLATGNSELEQATGSLAFAGKAVAL